MVFGVTYVLSVQYRSLLRPEKKILVGKKSSSHLSGRCAIVITTGKKNSSRLSGGCMIFITTGKNKILVVCLAGAQCIEFECNEFVLVLVQIDLIHFEHSICISST